MSTVYVVVTLNIRRLGEPEIVSAGIFSEREPSSPTHFRHLVAMEVEAVTFQEAIDFVVHQVKTEPRYTWLLPMLLRNPRDRNLFEDVRA